MKLTKIEIIHFGKLNNLTFDLKDNLSVFLGQNEAGKSTTVAFIKQILFGFHLKSNKSQFFEDYQPLAKVSPMGGKLYFEDGADHFVLERLYASGQSKKGVLTVTLNDQQVPETVFFSRIKNIDGDFYTDSFIFNQDLLSEVTRLSQAELMERIYFLGAAQSNKLLDLRDKYQSNASELFKKTGRKPVINHLLKEIADQETAVSQTQQEYEQYQTLAQAKAQLQPELQQLQKQAATINKRLQELNMLKQKIVNYQEYCSLQKQYHPVSFSEAAYNQAQTAIIEIENLQNNLKSNQEQLANLKQNANAIDFSGIDDLVDQKADFLQWQSEYRRLNKEIQNLQQEIQQIEQLAPLAVKLSKFNDQELIAIKNDYQQAKAQENKKASGNKQLFVVFGGLLAAIGLVTALTNSNLLVIAIVMIIAGGAGLYYGLKQNSPEPNNAFEQKYGFTPESTNLDDAIQQMLQLKLKQGQINNTKQDLTEIVQQLKTFLAAVQKFYPDRQLQLGDIAASLQNLQRRSQEQRDQINQQKTIQNQIEMLNKQLIAKKQFLLELLNHNQVKDFAAFKALKAENEQQHQIKLKLDTLKNNLSVDLEGLEKLTNSETDLAQKEQSLQNENNQVSQKLTELQQQLAELKVKQQQLADSDAVFKQKQLLANLQAELEEESTEYLSDLLVAKWIARSLDLASNERFPKMLQAAKEYFRLLTGNRYVDLLLDKKLTVINQDHKKVAVEYLSRGTSEQLYFALKLAFIEQIADEIALPVLIDDAFVNFDEQRTEYIEQLLKKLAAKTQVLIFTHRQRLADSLQTDILHY